MYENGNRELSSGASVMESLLSKCHAAASIATSKPGYNLSQNALAAFKKELSYQVAKHSRDIDEYLERLQKMKEEYLQLQVRRETLKKLKIRLETISLQTTQGSDESKLTLKRIEYIHHFQVKTGVMLDECSIIHQLQLQYHLDCLKAQKLAAENILKQAEL